MPLKLSLRRPISSLRFAGGSRRFKSRVRSIESAVSTTVLSGRSARPVISQLARKAASSAGIDEMMRKPRRPLRFSVWMLVGWPATTKRRRPRSGRDHGPAKRRSWGAPGVSTVASAPRFAAASSRVAGTAGAAPPIRPVLKRTTPDEVNTSVNRSVRCCRSSAPTSDGVVAPLSSPSGAVRIDVRASAARCLRESSWVVAWLFAASSYTSQPKARRVSATRAAPKNVSRRRNDTSGLAQAVAEASDRLDQRWLAVAVQLGAQISDVDCHHVVVGILAGPDGSQELVSSQHLARVPHEVSEQGELAGGERDHPLAATDLAGLDFQVQMRKLEKGGGGRRAAQQCADTGQELRIGERLDQVVVGAGVEAANAIGRPAACREHQDGQGCVRPQLPAHLQSIDAGHHQVEDYQVVPLRTGLLEGVGAAERDVDLVAFGTEDALDGGRDHWVVIDHQDAPGACAHVD